MKKIFYFLTALTVVFIIGCSKNNDLQLGNDLITEGQESSQTLKQTHIKNSDFTANVQSLSNGVNYFGFSNTEIESIGLMHNSFLRNGVKDLTIHSENLETSLYNNFVSIAPEDIGNNEIDQLLNIGNTGFQIEEGTQYFNNPLTLELYNELISKSHLDSIESYQTYLNYLDGVKNIVNTNLSNGDKEFMLICLSIAKYSSKLWIEVDKGGEGFYDQLHPRQQIQPRWSWRGALAGDISGAAGAFLAYGFGLAVPGTNAAIAGVIAYNAAYGSAMGGLIG